MDNLQNPAIGPLARIDSSAAYRAHDFNNLITVIQGNLAMLEVALPDVEQRDMLKSAQDAVALLAVRHRPSRDPQA